MNWQTATFISTLYDRAVQNRRLAPLGARILWNYDITNLRAAIAAQDPTALTLDIPCGGGLSVDDNPHHVAADLSSTMLRRARRRTSALLQTNIYALPFAPATFEACVTYNGLHCLDDPPTAIAELTRVLRPGGILTGTTITTGTNRDPLIKLFQRLDIFGNPGTPADLRTWLTSAGLTAIEITPSGAVTGFTARK